MSSRRSLSSAGRLIAGLLAAASAGFAGDVSFVAPRDGDLLAGETTFRFAVREASPVARIDVYVAGEMIGSAEPPGWSLRWNATAHLVGARISAVAFTDSGELVERVGIRTSDTVIEEWLDVKAVQLFPVVTDRSGRYVRGLGREAFTVLDQNRPVAIEYFSEELGDLTVSLLLDMSRSMSGKLTFVSEAACRFLDQLRGGDRVSAYAFNHGLLAGPPGRQGVASIQSFVRALVPAGGTAMYDALSKVLGELEPVTGRKAVILFSDGQDEASLLTLAHVVNRARGGDAIIYTVGAGTTAKDIEARADLETLAEETGGEAFFFASYQKLDAVFTSVLADLRSQYALSYTPPSGESGMRAIEVRVADPKYRVRCRRSYYYEKRL